MPVGSYASNVWGRPRSSHDADVVVRITPRDADRFHQAFSKDFVLQLESLRRDLDRGAMFNLIPIQGFFKVDIIPIRKTAYAQEEFGRRKKVEFLGGSLWVASPEDTILHKLAWYKAGDESSGRQLEDARDVYAIQRATMDESYLDRWAYELGVRNHLDTIRASARPSS